MSLELSHALALSVATDEIVRLTPSLDTERLAKALRLAGAKEVKWQPRLGCYLYQSPRQERPYCISIARALRTENLYHSSCTCDDYINRGEVCKHCMAAWLTHRVEEILSAAKQLQTISQIDRLDRYVQWAFS